MCTGNYTFIPYMVTPHNKVYCCDSSFMKGLTELMQPNFELLLGPICLPLVDRFVQLLKVAQASSREHVVPTVGDEPAVLSCFVYLCLLSHVPT